MPSEGKYVVGVVGASSLVAEGLRAMLLELDDIVESVLVPESKEDCDRCAVLFMDRALWREVQPDARVLVVCASDTPDSEMLRPPFPHGYLFPEYLTRDALRQQIGDCLQERFVLPIHVLKRLEDTAPASDAVRDLGILTTRERQSLALIALGLSNSQIAGRLRVTENTVKRLIALTMGKLAAPNRTAAVLTAIRQGLLPCPASGNCSDEGWASYEVELHALAGPPIQSPT